MNTDMIIAAFTATVVVLILSSFSIIFTIIYKKKQQTYKSEKELLQIRFQQQLLQSQLEMQEQTFNIISQEIHDNVGQALSLAKLQLNLLEQGTIFNKNLIIEIKESVTKAISDLRDIARSLNTDRIQQSDLLEVIGHELSRISRSGLMCTNLQVEGKELSIESQKKLILFRIIQEALQNILKHSRATCINISFHYHEECLKIEVTDNGKGFDTNAITKKDGLGLHNIINRTALIGGNAIINSSINKGTTIAIITPYI